ncbi:MAG: LamG domain-containing protein [Planctomycetota bacterium]|jgi:hypothetical protein
MKTVRTNLLLVAILALLAQCGQASVESMISYWRMDEDTGNIAFDSIGDSDGTIIGDPQRPGKVGNALIFDGIDDYVEVPDFSDWNTNITIEAWIYWDQSDPSQVWWYYDTIAILGDPVAWNGYVLYVYPYSDNSATSGKLTFCSGYDELNNTYSEVLSTVPLSQGEWHHIVATADGTTMSVYIDGVPNNSIPQLYPPVLNPGLMIGYDTWGTAPTNRHFDGTIDEMAIYNRVLTAEEIQGHYENGLIGIGYLDYPGSAESMISYWRMDEDTGNIAFDSIGDSDGTIIGDPQRPAKVGNALSFDGIDDYVVVPDFSNWNTNITIEAWIYWDQSDPSQVSWYYDTIAILGDTDAWDGYALYVYQYSDNPVLSGRLTFYSGYDWSNPDSEVLSTDPLSQEEWHHIVATADGTTMSVYIDGQFNNSIAQLNAPVLNPGLMIGDDTWGRHFDGTIDEMAIYNRVLTAEEIQGHYENGLIGIGYPCVEIDIKPGSYPNAINLGSHGVIPVAILTTDFFDATTVDPGSVMLEGLGVALRGKSDKLLASEEDVDGDGDNDLIVKINTENLEPGIWQDGPVLLTGSTYDGQDIVGTDDIIVVPPEE